LEFAEFGRSCILAQAGPGSYMDAQQILQFPHAGGGAIRHLHDTAFRKGVAT